jgi:hypothetical protein
MSPRRSLPSLDDARRIFAEKRTRPARKPAPAVGRALTPFIKALDARFGQGPGALQARWREIVGEALARRSEPAKLVKSRGATPAVLEIRVEGPSAALIQHQSTEILARVNLFLGAGAVGRLRIVQGPITPRTDAKPAKAPCKIRQAPLDAAAEAELKRSLDAAKTPELKDRLERLGRAVLAREPERR